MCPRASAVTGQRLHDFGIDLGRNVEDALYTNIYIITCAWTIRQNASS